MKRYLMALILIATMSMFGCTAFKDLAPQLSVYPESTVGAVSFDSPDLEMRFSVSGGVGIINVDYGDGSELDSNDGEGIVWFEHKYTEVGVFTAKFSRGNYIGKSTITVTAPGFDVYYPRGVGFMYYKYQFVEFTLLPRRVGCDNGTDDMVYHGIFPSDAEAYMSEGIFGRSINLDLISEDFEMYIRLTNADGSNGYAYSEDGEIISNKWVSVQQFGLFVDWAYAAPYAPYSFKSVGPLACEVGGIEEEPVIGVDTPFVNIQIDIVNKRGVKGSIHWPIYFSESGCI